MNHKNNEILEEIFPFFSHQEKKAEQEEAEKCTHQWGKAKKEKKNIIISCIVGGLMKKRKRKVQEIFMKIKENYAVSEMKKKNRFLLILFF